jgi:hypothetical protein
MWDGMSGADDQNALPRIYICVQLLSIAIMPFRPFRHTEMLTVCGQINVEYPTIPTCVEYFVRGFFGRLLVWEGLARRQSHYFKVLP